MPPVARTLLAVLGVAAAAAAAGQTLHRDADFTVAPQAEAPPQDASWRQVILPDQWKADPRGESGPGWYRVTFQVDRPGREPWLVYLPRLREGGTLYVNGRLLARVPEPDAKTWVRWMRPHAFPIPPDELHAGENVLHVRINPANRDRIISSIHIGPEEAVRPLYESRFFITYTLAQIISAVTIAVALFVIAVWLRRRMELDYGLFGLACLFWGIHTLNYVIEAVPDPWWLAWRVLRYAATGGFAVAITLFYLRYAGIRPRGMTRAFGAYWLSGPLGLALLGPGLHPIVDRYYQAGLLLMGVVMVGAAAYAVWRQRTVTALAFLACGVFGLAASVHDYLLSQGLLVDPEGPYLLYFGAGALLIVVGAQLVDRFARSLGAVERMNVTLAEQVAEKERELAANYEKLRGLERERAMSDERQRIMQDMHDGLGSQLLTSLAAVERGALDPQGMAQVLRDAMDDMRLAIDTLSPGREGLLEALGNLRYRLEPRFRAAGIELAFAYRDLPERLEVSSDDALQILRVLQESLTNVLKHARARRVLVEVSLAPDPARFVLAVADDGGGFDPAAPAAGRGLS
ncbi:MAG TPA: 7TM diverse intracellular signaling domain-containing protein, partial [Burkholderiales bacterium]|nr:7TM diverse intracellular signaling domain-containing protein [Burkholderiales bacterium]